MNWCELLDEAAQTLNLKIESYCEKLNNKESSRYFHADCSVTDSNEHLWRLKVVNINHNEVNSIRDCLYHNNLVHPIIGDLPSLLSILRIPQFFPIPDQYLKDWGCSERLELQKPGVEDIPLLVRKLLGLQGKAVSVCYTESKLH